MYPNNPLTIGQASFQPYVQQPMLYYPPQQMVQQPAPQQAVPQGPHMEIQTANGEQSAYAFLMGPNSSVILADTMKPKIWIVTTDSSNFKTVKGYRIIPDEEEEKPEEKKEDPISELLKHVKELEERMNRYEQSNYQSNNASQSDSAGTQTTVWDNGPIAGYDGTSKSDVSK